MTNFFKSERSGIRFRFSDVLICYNSTQSSSRSSYSNIKIIDGRIFLLVKLKSGDEYKLYYHEDEEEVSTASRFLTEFDEWCEKET